MREMQFRVGNDRIVAEIFEPTIPNGKKLLFIPGWRSTQASYVRYARRLERDGYTSLTYDLGGMGRSGGAINALTRADYLDEAVAAYDQLVNATGDGNVCVVSSSFSAYLACLLTERRPIDRLVLKVPANFVDDGFNSPQILLSDELDKNGLNTPEPPSDTVALNALRKFNGKVLVVTSENDKLISPRTTQDFLNAVNEDQLEHRIMHNAPHGISKLPEFQAMYEAILVNWFENWLR